MTKNLEPDNAAVPVRNKQTDGLTRDSVGFCQHIQPQTPRTFCDMSPHLHASHSVSDLTNLEDAPELPFNDSLKVLFEASLEVLFKDSLHSENKMQLTAVHSTHPKHAE